YAPYLVAIINSNFRIATGCTKARPDEATSALTLRTKSVRICGLTVLAVANEFKRKSTAAFCQSVAGVQASRATAGAARVPNDSHEGRFASQGHANDCSPRIRFARESAVRFRKISGNEPAVRPAQAAASISWRAASRWLRARSANATDRSTRSARSR